MASRGGRECFVCGSTEHLKRDCPSYGGRGYHSRGRGQGGDRRTGRGQRDRRQGGGRGRDGGRGSGRGGGDGRGGRGGGDGRGGRGDGRYDVRGSASPHDVENKSSEVYVDTHIHIDSVLEKMRQPFDELRRRYYPENFQYCIAIFSDPAAFSPSFSTWKDHFKSDMIYGAFGMHPHNAQFYTESLEERIIECLQHEKALAWGEIGLDFHYNRSPQDKQKEVFAQQCKLAVVYAKPVVVHSRKAPEETFAIMKEHLPADWRIHVHCFSDKVEHAKLLLENFPNLYIGITGAVTFRSADDLRNVVEAVPLEKLLLETDGPWMAPQPSKRGKTCHSGHIPAIAKEIARVKKLTLDEVLSQIRKNTTSMYGI